VTVDIADQIVTHPRTILPSRINTGR
jgi:hypothetical protein